MSWAFSSFLSRFHRRARRQPTAEPPLQDTGLQPQHEPSVQQLLIDRKILQDPSSFLDAVGEDALPLGLTPSTRFRSGDGSGNTRSRVGPIDLSDPRSGRNEMPPDSRVDISPRTQSVVTISRIPEVAAGGEWSTFGRKRERRVPYAAGLSGSTPLPDGAKCTSHSVSPARDSGHLSAESTPSTSIPSRVANRLRPSGSIHEEHPSPSSRSARESADILLGGRVSSPANTMSSKRHPRTPHRRPSDTARATSSTTAVNQEADFDSPHSAHTFGHLTPPNNPLGSSVAYTSPPPPLPPLDHAESATVLLSRRKSTSTGQPALSAFRDRLNTLPTNDHPLASLSLKLGRRRARTTSGDTRGRRTSADWSSYQASLGVNVDGHRAWPAEVSREILKLSFARPDVVPGSSGELKVRTRGRSRTSTVLDQGALSPSFLPFPLPSQPDCPPSSASATLPDPREIHPRSRSLQFYLGYRTGGEQPGRFAMANVKRSLSAIEARNGTANGAGGATYTSLGLDGPAPALSQAPSSAPTPSQSLSFGRVSLAHTPMSPSMRGEPSTPTPAPRQLSDKSRGKRKAEDNIDLTPPEQKKEGQHATFLLPSQSRSQRVSNSSHAPSSYHRKRARLSSTSPSATPVQSRPSSVQETPQPTGRNHHFTSLSSSTGTRIAPPHTPSRAASARSRQPLTPSTAKKHERRQSISQASIPISAFISPHAPSISRSTKFHMRDPRKPPKKPNDTPWGLRFATEDEPGSPTQAWCFFFGFLFFPIWWIAGFFLRVPMTRIAGDVDAEKGVAIDDPQIEHDARTWRFRCRVMSIMSVFTYIPFIVLVAIFAPR